MEDSGKIATKHDREISKTAEWAATTRKRSLHQETHAVMRQHDVATPMNEKFHQFCSLQSTSQHGAVSFQRHWIWSLNPRILKGTVETPKLACCRDATAHRRNAKPQGDAFLDGSMCTALPARQTTQRQHERCDEQLGKDLSNRKDCNSSRLRIQMQHPSELWGLPQRHAARDPCNNKTTGNVMTSLCSH